MDPKCGHAKVKLHMFNYLQQLSSGNLIFVKHWEKNKNLSTLLNKGKPMIDYEDFLLSFQFLKI
jgi:hypothetical protein